MLPIFELFGELVTHIQLTLDSNINMILVGVLQLKAKLMEIGSTTTNEVATIAVFILLKNIDKRLKITDEMTTAAILDPAFQNLPAVIQYLAEQEITKIDLINKMCEKYGIQQEIVNVDLTASRSSSAIVQPAAKKVKRDFRSLLFTRSIQTQPAPIVANTIADELRMLAHEPAQIDEKINEFWLRKETDYPTLAKLAKIILTRHLTTARVESEFSSAGALVSARRAKLTPLTVQKTLFIHDNYHLITGKSFLGHL